MAQLHIGRYAQSDVPNVVVPRPTNKAWLQQQTSVHEQVLREQLVRRHVQRVHLMNHERILAPSMFPLPLAMSKHDHVQHFEDDPANDGPPVVLKFLGLKFRATGTANEFFFTAYPCPSSHCPNSQPIAQLLGCFILPRQLRLVAMVRHKNLCLMIDGPEPQIIPAFANDEPLGVQVFKFNECTGSVNDPAAYTGLTPVTFRFQQATNVCVPSWTWPETCHDWADRLDDLVFCDRCVAKCSCVTIETVP